MSYIFLPINLEKLKFRNLERQVRGMVYFILGMAAGIALHRLIMAMVLEKSSDNLCSYCEWMARKKGHHWM